MANKNTDYDSTDYEFLKRIRDKVLKYPVIREIFYLMVFPLLRDKPMRMSADAWLEGMWDPYHNPIKVYTTTKPTRIPGAYWREEVDAMGSISVPRRIPGYKSRYLNGGKNIWCRFDIKHRTVDVEAFIKKENKYCTFTLNVLQWEQLSKTLKEKV